MIFSNKNEVSIFRSFSRPIREVNIHKLHSIARLTNVRFVVVSNCTKLIPIPSDCHGKRIIKEHGFIEEPNKFRTMNNDIAWLVRNYPMLNMDQLDDASLQKS